jgi:hypothetical protein
MSSHHAKRHSGMIASLCLMSVGFIMASSGCGSPSWATSGGANSPTDGLSIDLRMEGAAQKIVHYQLNGAGRLWFAGGRDVAIDRWTWEGDIDPARGQAIARAVAAGHWFTNPPSGDGGDSATWKIKATSPTGGSTKFTVSGQADSVDAVYAELEAAAASRFGKFLDTLPTASQDRQRRRNNWADTGGDAPKEASDP